MTNKWNDKSWQKAFLNMKSHSPSDAKLLMGGVKGLKDAWRLGVLHVEIRKTEEKTNTTRSRVLRFVEDPVGYKIDLIERDL